MPTTTLTRPTFIQAYTTRPPDPPLRRRAVQAGMRDRYCRVECVKKDSENVGRLKLYERGAGCRTGFPKAVRRQRRAPSFTSS